MAFFGKPSQPSRRPEPKKTPPLQKPKTLFEEKKHWEKPDFLRRTTKTPFTTPTGKGLLDYERKKMMGGLFPHQRFGTFVSEPEVKRRLRELRSEEYRAKTGNEKKRLSGLRSYLEKETGLKGKY